MVLHYPKKRLIFNQFIIQKTKSFLIILNFLSFDSYVVRQIKTYLFAYRYFSTAQIFTYKNKLVDKIEKFTIYFLFFNVSYCVSKIMLIFILVIQQPYNCIFFNRHFLKKSDFKIRDIKCHFLFEYTSSFFQLL